MEPTRSVEERRAIVARFERGLASLATLVEDSRSTPEAIARAADLCEDAFRAVQSLGESSSELRQPDELERAQRLLAVAVESVTRETEFTARRLRLATSARRGVRGSMAPPEVGESCNVAG